MTRYEYVVIHTARDVAARLNELGADVGKS
jgi:hypothetical protein